MTGTASDELVWRQLHWQRPLDPRACLGLLSRLAADQRSPRVVLETRGSRDGVQYLLGVSRASLKEVEGAIVDAIPGTTLTLPTSPRQPDQAARQLRASTRHRALQTDDPPLTARLVLSALSAVRSGEQLTLQIVLGPRRIPLAVPNNSPSSIVAPWYVVVWHGNGGKVDGEKRGALRDKVSHHGFACAVRIGVTAATEERRRQLVLSLLAALRTSEAAGLQLSQGAASLQRLVSGRRPILRWPLRLNTHEVLAFTAWPLGDADLPGQAALHPRRLPPAPGTTSGRVVALSGAPGHETEELRLTAKDALHHLHVIGPTGVGKSVLLGRLIEQEIAEGRGVVVIEPKGDLVDDVLARVPANRRDDIVILDPSDSAPVGLNPLAGSRLPEVAADGVLSVFRDLYADSWGPRTQDILHACLLTLARRGDASLVMLPLLLTNAGFRRSVTHGLHDPIALEPFWGWFEALSDAERGAVIAPVMNKLRAWLINPNLRAVLGQRLPRFNLNEVFTEKRILLVPLRRGVVGAEAAKLLGSLVVAQLWRAVEGRAAVPASRRQPVMVYIDEVQDYLHLPTDLGEALVQARGLGVGFTLAHQHLTQLPSSMRAAVLSNARSRVCFQLGHDDAVALSKGRPEVSGDDLTALGRYQVYASLFGRGQVNPYAFGTTVAPSPRISSPVSLRNASRRRYGRSLTEVEMSFAELVANTAAAGPEAPGRRRRSA